jgi:hypothetical protein
MVKKYNPDMALSPSVKAAAEFHGKSGARKAARPRAKRPGARIAGSGEGLDSGLLLG